MSDLERRLRAAHPDDPDSLEALASALARAGHRPVAVRHYELLVDRRDAVIMTAGRRFEVLAADGDQAVAFEVAESLGYGLAFGPTGIWAEAELARTTLDRLVLREKVRATGDHGGAVTVDFVFADAPQTIIERHEVHGRSSRVPVGTLYDAIGIALRFACVLPSRTDPAAPTTVRDWSEAEPR